MSFNEDIAPNTGNFEVVEVQLLNFENPNIIYKSFPTAAKAAAWLGRSNIPYYNPKTKLFPVVIRNDKEKSRYHLKIIKKLL